MTRRFVFEARPVREVIALWDMCSSSSEVSWSSPVMLRRRLDWIERIFRLDSVERPCYVSV
jgi:hypothetical protein